MNLFYARIKDGHIIPSNKKSFNDYLSTVEGKEVFIEIDRFTGKRSYSQNNFYWLYLGVIERETGNSAVDLHELFKRKFLPPIPKKILGTEFRIPSSTTTLSKTEFGEYIDKICALTGVPIPVIEKKEIKEIEYPHEDITPLF